VLGVRLVPGLGGPPLYDGVVPVGPYQWLTPGPGQQGGAKGATATVAVNGGQNDLLAIATQESLPQAQLLAIPGSLVLRPGATSLQVAITPVLPPGQPTDGTLASNVYRFEVKDQNGADATARASAKVSIVLRSADAALLTGIVERWDGSAWTPLKTAPPGVSGAYLATVTEFGDYAVVQPGRAASPAPSGASAASTGPKPTAASGASGLASATVPPGSSAAMGDDTASGGPALVGPIAVAALVALVAFAVIVLLRRRSGPPPTDPPAPKPGRKPRGAKSPPYRGAHRVGRD
jgi:hypothetical protein